jgi:hypothetical protein
MRLLFSTLIAASALVLYTASASAIEFNLGISTSGDPGALVIGDTVDVDVFMDNPLQESYLGVGTALIYDPAVYALTGVTPRSQIELQPGVFATPVLVAQGTFGPSFLDNVIDPNEQSPGVVLMVNALSTSPSAGTGSDPLETRPHASVELTVIGLGDGTISTGFGVGQTLVDASGGETPELAIFDSETLTIVPEPGTALLMGLGLAGLGAAGRRRA